MNPLEQRVKELETMLAAFVGSDRYTSQKHLQMFDGRNIQTGRSVGTKIGTAADQKVGFFGVAPVIQQAAITKPSGGGTVDAQSRAAINSIIDALHNIGIDA